MAAEPRVNAASNIRFTINNPSSLQVEWLIAAQKKTDKGKHPLFRFIVLQLETAPTTGTVHIQGFVSLKKPLRYTSKEFCKHLYCDGRNKGNCGIARGTAAENLAYCTKDESRCTAQRLFEYFGCADLPDDEAEHVVARGPGPWVGGECPVGKFGQPGKRSDLDAFAMAVADGASDVELLESFPGMTLRFGKEAERVRQIKRRAQEPELTLERLLAGNVESPEVIIFQGPTGSGKSHAAMVEALTRFKADEIYQCEATSKLEWHDGLLPQHKVMIIQEQVPYKYRDWLKITDKWSFNFPRRHIGSLLHKFKLIMVASTLPWQTWFKAGEASLGEFARRITEVRRMFEHRCVEVEKGPFGADGRPAAVAVAPPPAGLAGAAAPALPLPLHPPPPAGGVVSEVGGNYGPPTSGYVPPGHFAPIAPAPVGGVGGGGGAGPSSYDHWLMERNFQAFKQRALKRVRDEFEQEVPRPGSPIYEVSDGEEDSGEGGGGRSPPHKKARHE